MEAGRQTGRQAGSEAATHVITYIHYEPEGPCASRGGQIFLGKCPRGGRSTLSFVEAIFLKEFPSFFLFSSSEFEIFDQISENRSNLSLAQLHSSPRKVRILTLYLMLKRGRVNVEEVLT